MACVLPSLGQECYLSRVIVGELRLTLQDLEVLEVCIFGVDVELDAGHWDIKVDAVKDLAKSRSVCLSALSSCSISVLGGMAG